MPEIPATMRQLQSIVTPSGELHLSIESVETPRPDTFIYAADVRVR